MKLSIQQILNLQEMKVLNSDEIEGLGLGLVIEIQRDSECALCPKCGKLSYSKHQNHWRMVKDLPWGKNAVFLRINRRQFSPDFSQAKKNIHKERKKGSLFDT